MPMPRRAPAQCRGARITPPRPDRERRLPRSGRGRALLRAAAALLAAGVAACRSARSGDPSITSRDLRAHVEALTSDKLQGRLPGTPGYELAAAYAADALERAGVDAVGAGAGRARYYPTVRMVRQRIGTGTVLELQAGRGASRLQHGRRTFLLLATGDPSRAMPARPPVFVGTGLHAPAYGIDDLAGLDLRDRAVLLTAFPPRAAELARLPGPVARMYASPAAAQRRRFTDLIERGAAAILLVPDRWLVDEWETVSEKQRQLYYQSVDTLPGWEPDPPIPVAVLHADLVDRLFVGRGYHPISHAGRYRTFTLDDVALRLIVDAHADRFTAENVVGVVRGRDRSLRDEYVVVGAQLDGEGRDGERVLPGAREATACAAVLEAAAATALNPPRRSVLFVLFTAEAGGRWGSRHFLAHPPVAGGRMVAAIDVARLGARIEGGARTQAYAAAPLLEVARRVAEDGPHDALDVHDALGHPESYKGTAAASFAEAQVPFVLLAQPAAADGPAAHDDVKRIDWRASTTAARLLHALLVEAADVRPASGVARRRVGW